ncbi:MAG TPA: hypothetical protein PLV19_03790 [Nitrosomonas sp.]|nr:hypothetical protein [Nitrosomonas sp.]HQX13277.1 hypothetical protein [Nitrosomonas sp.]HRB32001.1 hypothetical protein [Nitrosomonas sp.]HRB76935.1 hypothetical protein [Nitrosomonas sp.]
MYHAEQKINQSWFLLSLVILSLVIGVSNESVPNSTQEKNDASNIQSAKNWKIYNDSQRQFKLSYPSDFVAVERKQHELNKFTPSPQFAIIFMNDMMASSQFAGIEPADLEIKAYRLSTQQTLNEWLESTGFAHGESGSKIRHFPTKHIHGLEVCGSTMAAPGCSVYVVNANFIFQLTPASQSGEAMMESFELSN